LYILSHDKILIVMRISLALVLFLILLADVTYGIVTYNSPYGCSYFNRVVAMPDQTQPNSNGANLQVLGNPCFYIIYYGIVGGSATLISFVATLYPEKRVPLFKKEKKP
jgi:hypothetical protein